MVLCVFEWEGVVRVCGVKGVVCCVLCVRREGNFEEREREREREGERGESERAFLLLEATRERVCV